MKPLIIKWRILDDNAKIPSKTKFAAGYDIYTIEKDIYLQPHSKKMFATGIAFCMSRGDYWLMAFDRGSTGSNGLHVHCGVIDTDYRGEIFICLCNDNEYPVHFTDEITEPVLETKEAITMFSYPVSKAIAQLIPVAMPICKEEICGDEEWKQSCLDSDRGEGKLGSSKK